jgi:hypothetical protein
MFSFIRQKVLELDQATQAEPVRRPENHAHHSVESDHRDGACNTKMLSIINSVLR